MKLSEKIYAQLANRVYDREDIRNKMTLPEGITELKWMDDNPSTGFSAGVYRAEARQGVSPRDARGFQTLKAA